jgi:hypothetical protein
MAETCQDCGGPADRAENFMWSNDAKIFEGVPLCYECWTLRTFNCYPHDPDNLISRQLIRQASYQDDPLEK